MPKDWEKSRTQLLTELRRLRKERDRLARQGLSSPEPDASEISHSRLDTLYQVTASLSSMGTLAEVAPSAIGELAECLGWDAGILWLTSEPEGILHFAGCWHAVDVNFRDLESLSRQATFLPGRGPLGHFWGNGEQPAIFDVSLESRSPRALYALQAGLHWVSYFPIWHEQTLVGFFEFFGSELAPPDGEHTKLLAASGQQVVQRLLRERAEQQCQLLDALAGPLVEFAVIELDSGGRIVRWGKDAERLQGFQSNEVLGKHVSFFYPASDGERAETNLASAASRGFLKDGGWRMRRGDERFWADVIILPKRAPHGELVGFTKVVHGLTVPEVAAFTREKWLSRKNRNV